MSKQTHDATICIRQFLRHNHPWRMPLFVVVVHIQLLRLSAHPPRIVIHRQQPLASQRVQWGAHLHAVRHVQSLALRCCQPRVYLHFDVILHVHKALLCVAHIHQVIITRVVHQPVIAVYLHLKLLHHDTTHMRQQRNRRTTPFRMSEPRLVPFRHHVPKRVHRAKYHKPHPAAHLISLLDWYRYPLRIDAELIVHVVLQVKLGANYLITNLRVKPYRKALLIVFVLVLTLCQRLILTPLKVRHLSSSAFLHHTLITYYQHTRQHTHLRYVVAVVTNSTILELIHLRAGIRKRNKATHCLRVPHRFLIRRSSLPPLLRVVSTFISARHQHLKPFIYTPTTVIVVYSLVSITQSHHRVQHQFSAQHNVVRRALVCRRKHTTRHAAVIHSPRHACL